MAGRPPFEPSREQHYPLIDSDPHFTRVVRFMRLSDYAYWAAFTAGTPVLFWRWEILDPTHSKRLLPALRMAGVLGFMGGFLFAYQRSSLRFWGWKENAREVEKDWNEMTKRVREGKPLYGRTDLSDYLQGAAQRNSQYSQLKLSVIPWFNTINHNRHGVDPSMYGVPPAPETKPEASTPQPR